MSYRYMRLLVFFDLPTITSLDKKEYRQFRKFLIKDGFIMMQESVYSKLTLNQSVLNSEMKRVREHSPKKGIVEMLSITEKQYARIEYLICEKTSNVEDSDERLLIL